MAGDKNYLDLLDKMKELHIKKNAGYSGDSQDRWANFRESEGFGVTSILGVLVRMSDKWIRIKNLIKNPNNEQVGEAITDTLMDLASYALITICLINEPKLSEVLEVYIVPVRLDETLWYKDISTHLHVIALENFDGKYYQCVDDDYKDSLILREHCRVVS